jgi:hypothetical protein
MCGGSFTLLPAALSIEIDTLEQHQTEKIDTEVKDIEDMIGYESQKCMPCPWGGLLGCHKSAPI